MIDFSRIEGFDWDDGNLRKSLDRHGVSQLEAEQAFLDPQLLVLADEKHSFEETRLHALGMTAAGRKLQISFTLRHDQSRIRVISARNMNRKERAIYEKET